MKEFIFRDTSNLKHTYRNEWDKAYFGQGAAYFYWTDLAKRRFWKEELMKLLEFLNMIYIKDY